MIIILFSKIRIVIPNSEWVPNSEWDPKREEHSESGMTIIILEKKRDNHTFMLRLCSKAPMRIKTGISEKLDSHRVFDSDSEF